MREYVTGLHGDIFCEGIDATFPVHGSVRCEATLCGKRVLFGEAPSQNKNSGRYACIICGQLWKASDIQDIAGAVTQTFLHFEKLLFSTPPSRLLICALGNASLTADSLGYQTASLTLSGLTGKREASVINAPPAAVTGIRSSETVEIFTRHTSPELVICIDSLTALSPERLGSVVQVSDIGIRPGSGVSATNPAITEELLGVPIVSIGIPTVIRGNGGMVYTVAEIDELIRKGSAAVAGGINGYLATS